MAKKKLSLEEKKALRTLEATSFGERLNQVMKLAGYKQKKMAEMCGLKKDQFQRVLYGDRVLGIAYLKILKAMEKEYGITRADLMDECENWILILNRKVKGLTIENNNQQQFNN